MTYDHTQRGYLHWLLLLLAVVEAVSAAAIWNDEPRWISWLLIGIAVLFLTLGTAFAHLRVVGSGDRLLLRFGPLPLLRRQVPYAGITAVDAGKSSLIDGWGIHWVPGRGWTYNLWGFDCVVVNYRDSVIRIGTDDVAGLVAFLRTKIADTQSDEA